MSIHVQNPSIVVRQQQVAETTTQPVAPSATLSSAFKSTLAAQETRNWGQCFYDWTIGLLTRLFAWVFCYGVNTETQPASRPDVLARVKIPAKLPVVEKMDSRKRIWFENALKLFHKANLVSNYTVHSQGRSPFVLRSGKTPAYFSDRLPHLKDTLSSNKTGQLKFVTSTYYDYVPCNPKKYYEAFVDYCNRQFGGGFLEPANCMEEVLFSEFPELALHGMTQRLSHNTRSEVRIRSGGDRPQEGSPTPLLFEGVWRTQRIDVSQTYGGLFNRNVTMQNAHSFVEEISPQQANILAMASPKLAKKSVQNQVDPKNLEDLFNTFVAGFKLIKKQADKAGLKGLAHTGPIGTGAFKQDKSIVFALQLLAADYVGIRLGFYGYTQQETKSGLVLYYKLWKAFTDDFRDGEQQTIQNFLKVAPKVCQNHLEGGYLPFDY